MLLAVDLSGAGHGVWLLLPFFLVHSGGRVSPLRLNTRVAGNMPKRAATDDGDAPKKKMPPMQSTPHASDVAGWSSDPSLKLSPAMLADLESIEALPALPAHLVKHEKDGFETL